MEDFKGSFLGFTFNGVHSSELGIVRTSDGMRFNDNLLPNFQDKTSQVPGADGMYYFNSNYTQKPFNLPIAFDHLTESQLRRLKTLFGDKGVHELIFDETPYKVYMVKINSAPSLKYISFDEDIETYCNAQEYLHNKSDLYGGIGDDYYVGVQTDNSTIRIYKGEGTISFIAYSPFAKSRFKFKDQYVVRNIPEWGYNNNASSADIFYNANEWMDSLNLIASNYSSDTLTIDTPTANGCLVYNPGDMPTSFKFKIQFTTTQQTIPTVDLAIGDKQLTVNGFTLAATEYGMQINTKLHLIEGLDVNGKPTGNVYNRFITYGDFFDLDIMDSPQELEYSISTSGDIEIVYDYLYY